MGSHSSLDLAPYGIIPTFHDTATSKAQRFCVASEAKRLVSHGSCLSGHTVEEATTISKSVISPLLSKYVFISYLAVESLLCFLSLHVYNF